MAEMNSGQDARLRFDLILHVIRRCPSEFLAAAAAFPESDTPLNGLRNLGQADLSTRRLAQDAAMSIAKTSTNENKLAARFIDLLGKPRALGPKALKELDERDSRDLAAIAERDTQRAGASQVVLVEGTFIMWIVNRAAINSAFQAISAAQAWLKPYPPTVVEVGPVLGDAQYDAVAEAIRKTALQFSGPVDLWFRKFKIEP
jgi:hypothetical protein